MAASKDTAELKKLDKAHNFYSWSIQGTLAPMMVSHATGMYVYDTEGAEYLDFRASWSTPISDTPTPRWFALFRSKPKPSPRSVRRIRRSLGSRLPLASSSWQGRTSRKSFSLTVGRTRSRTPFAQPDCSPRRTRCSPPIAATTGTPALRLWRPGIGVANPTSTPPTTSISSGLSSIAASFGRQAKLKSASGRSTTSSG